MMNDKHLGAYNELIATVWLLKEGYEVFRNISMHGPVDLVAMKDGELHKFDVKGGSSAAKRLSAEQVALGVKILRVLPDGTCEIDWNPLSAYAPVPRGCHHCSTMMLSRSPKHIFCSDRCRSFHHVPRKGRLFRGKTSGGTAISQ